MRLTAFLIFLWALFGLVGSPEAPAVNEGLPAAPTKLNIPGPALLLFAAAALKLNPPGVGAAVHRNNKQKERQVQKIDRHSSPQMM